MGLFEKAEHKAHILNRKSPLLETHGLNKKKKDLLLLQGTVQICLTRRRGTQLRLKKKTSTMNHDTWMGHERDSMKKKQMEISTTQVRIHTPFTLILIQHALSSKEP